MSKILGASMAHGLGLVLALALAGCGGGGGGGGDGGTAPPPPAGNAVPQAAFNAGGSAVAQEVATFDARASSDADGDPLTYAWDFGDGSKGGGARIAHLYAQAGSYTVTLTVDDGHGGRHSVQRVQAVTPAAAAAATVQALVLVRTGDGTPLAGVTVGSTTGGAQATTGVDGRASVAVGTGTPQLLKFSKAGYADQWRSATLPAGAESGYIEARMLPREPALTLADAAAGGTLTGKAGAKLTLPAGALVDGAGNAVSGPVQVSMTPIDVAADVRMFPGRFDGVRPDGTGGVLRSYGTTEFTLRAGGAPVQLAAGRKATIELPIYTALHPDGSAMKAGDVVDLWSMDEATGRWIQEGTGTVVAGSSPSGWALRAEVQHFSWWNTDHLGKQGKYRGKCLVDTNLDGVLEDLTGTGYCWNMGTGPEQNGVFLDPGSHQARASAQTAAQAAGYTQRTPVYYGLEAIPAAGGVELPLPADVPIGIRAYAKNGTLFGTTLVTVAEGEVRDVTIVLYPVQDVAGSAAVTLPYDNRVLMSDVGEVDRFSFAADAGASYRVTVTPLTGSLLFGNVTVTEAGGAQLAGGAFGATPFSSLATAGSAGTLTVAVSAGAQAPGSYRIEIVRVANTDCASPTPLAVPSTTTGWSVPANGVRCFTLDLVAGQAIQIGNTQNLNSEGLFTLRNASGETLASDAYGTASTGAGLLRLGVAASGTYRLELSNTRGTTGTINGLGVSVLSATSVASGASVAANATSSASQFFLLQPASAGAAVAAKVRSTGAVYQATLYPGAISFNTGSAGGTTPVSGARVIKAHPQVLPLVELLRTNGTASAVSVAAVVPTAVAPDTDIDGTMPAEGDVAIYTFDGIAASNLSWASVTTDGSGSNAVVELVTPGGSGPGGLGRDTVLTLPESGAYTVLARGDFVNTGKPFRMRFNALPEPTIITPSAAASVSGTLALGEIKRYGFAASAGQVLGLGIARPGGSLLAGVSLVGGNAFNASAALAGSATSARSPALYVQSSAPAVMQVAASGDQLAQRTGPFSATLYAPTPTPVTVGTVFSGTAAAGSLATFGWTQAASEPMALCVRASGPAGALTDNLQGVVWGPTATSINYTGDLRSATGDGSPLSSNQYAGSLRAGANTFSMLNTSNAAIDWIARVRQHQLAGDLAVGGAAGSGTMQPCTRSYHRFPATIGTTYTVTVTANFAGTVRITAQSGSDFATHLERNPGVQTLAAGVPRVISGSFRANEALGSAATFVVEVEGDLGASGSYTVSVTSP